MCPDFPYIIQLSTPANGKVVKGQGEKGQGDGSPS